MCVNVGALKTYTLTYKTNKGTIISMFFFLYSCVNELILIINVRWLVCHVNV